MIQHRDELSPKFIEWAESKARTRDITDPLDCVVWEDDESAFLYFDGFPLHLKIKRPS